MQIRYIIVALVWSVVTVYGQPAKEIPLGFGDPVPDIRFEQFINYSSSNAKLSDFKGKLVILDFWATWCTSCLYGFPKLDSLQKVFGKRMQVMLINSKVTGDDSVKVSTFYKKWAARTGKPLELPCVINDSEAWNLFQPKLIPHYAWVNAEGKLIAITSSTPVNAANIQAVLNGEPVSFSMKVDQDMERPLFTSPDLPAKGLLQYSIFIKGLFDGLPGGNRQRTTDGIVHGRALTNTSILSLYKAALNGINPGIHDRRIILDIKDSSKLLLPKNINEQDAWNQHNLYSLDLIVPVSQAGRLYPIMLEELNKYSGYYGRMKKCKVKCWVLKRIDNTIPLRSNGGEMENNLFDTETPYLKNGTTKDIVRRFNYLDVLKLLVIDETGYSEKININFLNSLKDLPTIQRGLRQSGLLLVKMDRVVEMFVLSENP